ncbi:class I adenylate-forming enzyme family protein [Shouchella patagoniensis]|uniref:class I adenylate-forming enzyme family protein n=1 Tax=Shouchella patagoniensis TaxID=228576 RepID=UPI0009958269|nr:AMP-binding protein [Shouchella patagoniensis]
MTTLGSLAKKAFRQYSEEVAVVDRFRTLTYRELQEDSSRLANGLTALGLTKGDRVGILMSNRAEHVLLDVAVAMAGFIKVPINFKLHPKEMAYIIDHAGVSVLIGEKALLSPLTVDCPVYTVEHSLASFLAEQALTLPTINVVETDPYALMYTSGTTGRPKGAILSHRAMVSSAQSLMMACEISYDDIIGHVAPLTHGSNFLAQCALILGLKQVIFDTFDPVHFMDELEQEKITTIFMVPTILNMMIHEPSFTPYKLRYLKSINMAGAPIAVEKLHTALEQLGPIFAETYGLVEAPMTITIMPKRKLHERLASCGAVSPVVEMCIRDEDGKEVAQGMVGEVTCKGPLVMNGYWNNEEATAEAIRDGWFYTGDMGWVDEQGYLHLIDRKKDIIISGGMNIYPREVEEVLNEHPDVKETCVFGVPDDKWGESVYAHVVLKQGHTAQTADLLHHCKQNLASYKKPSFLQFVSELPKNSYGKILRRELRNLYKEGVK